MVLLELDLNQRPSGRGLVALASSSIAQYGVLLSTPTGQPFLRLSQKVRHMPSYEFSDKIVVSEESPKGVFLQKTSLGLISE